jgi:tetratricopeptide (TPR) repeat protein
VPRILPEAEIDAANLLAPKDDHEAALKAYQHLLDRTDDVNQRFYLLYQIVKFASLLDRQDVVRASIAELDTMPEPDFSRAVASLDRAYAEIELRRPSNALALLEATFETGIFNVPAYRMHLFHLYWLKGRALVWLNLPEDALKSLEQAESIYTPSTQIHNEDERIFFRYVMPSLLIEKANCLIALDRPQDSFDSASRVKEFDSPDWATLALQYMAESRAWQGLTEEALKLYAELIPQLPCSLVDEARVRKGMENCMIRLEKQHNPVHLN